jgi:hypothetical protein
LTFGTFGTKKKFFLLILFVFLPKSAKKKLEVMQKPAAD